MSYDYDCPICGLPEEGEVHESCWETEDSLNPGEDNDEERFCNGDQDQS